MSGESDLEEFVRGYNSSLYESVRAKAAAQHKSFFEAFKDVVKDSNTGMYERVVKKLRNGDAADWQRAFEEASKEIEEEARKAQAKQDDSVKIAKEIGTSAGKDAGVRLAKDVLLEGRPLLPSLEKAVNRGAEDIGKETVKKWLQELQQRSFPEVRLSVERAFGPNSDQALLVDLWGDKYFSTFGKDVMDYLPNTGEDALASVSDKNLAGLAAPSVGKLEGVPYGRRFGKQGFDFNVKPNFNLGVDWMKLAQKGPRPEVVKQVDLKLSIEATWRSRYVEARVGVEGQGGLEPKEAKSWSEVTRKDFLERHGHGDIKATADLQIKPNDRLSITFGAETSIGDKKDLDWKFSGGLQFEFGGPGRLSDDFYKKYGK